MRSLFFASAFIFCELHAEALQAQGLSISALKEKYSHIKLFSASVTQEKTAPYLFKPLTSEILLRYENNTIEWQTLKPVKSLVVIDSKGLRIQNPGEKSGYAVPRDPRVDHLIEFFRNLFTLDFEKIEKDFVLNFEGLKLVAVPREKAHLFDMDRLEFFFDKNFMLQRLLIKAKDENMTMKFSNLVIKR